MRYFIAESTEDAFGKGKPAIGRRGILSQREDEVFSQRALRLPSARVSPP
jgi:hypothetical protein